MAISFTLFLYRFIHNFWNTAIVIVGSISLALVLLPGHFSRQTFLKYYVINLVDLCCSPHSILHGDGLFTHEIWILTDLCYCICYAKVTLMEFRCENQYAVRGSRFLLLLGFNKQILSIKIRLGCAKWRYACLQWSSREAVMECSVRKKGLMW